MWLGRKATSASSKDQSILAKEVWLKYKACVRGNEVVKHTHWAMTSTSGQLQDTEKLREA